MVGYERGQNYTHRLYVNEDDVKKEVAPRLAVLNQHDHFVKCILNRAQRFLGSMGSPDFELLSLARYGVPHQVQLHSDASQEPFMDSKSKRRYNRRTSFFVYVHASDDLEGGETFFPRIPPPLDVGLPANSGIVSINNTSGASALAVKPVSRSAVFWVGVKPDGTVNFDTIHEGLPVTKGEKIGMNIWAKHYID
jgi:prolyl 4-hydroxylase